MAWSVDRLGGTYLGAKEGQGRSHRWVVLTGVPRWALADIFVTYTSSDRAGGHPWIRSGAHGAKRTSAYMGPSRHQSDTPPPKMLFAHSGRPEST
jgi:hypothetical protein